MSENPTVAWIEEQVRLDLVGQSELLELSIASLVARAHVLLEGPPGVAKTLVAQELAGLLGLRFARIQMTPDLLPGDLLGTNVWLPNEGRFDFRAGPVFTDVLLADELNRAPPKSQSALLEAMQERRVTLEGREYDLGRNFWVIATQNPLEHEGTFPLPESQLDRFALCISVPYPSSDDELEIVARHLEQGDALSRWRQRERDVVNAERLESLQSEALRVHVDLTVQRYVVELVNATRTIRELSVGAGPRAILALLDVGRALAVVRGRAYLIPDDIRDLFAPCIAHRVRVSPEAQISGLGLAELLERVLASVPVPDTVAP